MSEAWKKTSKRHDTRWDDSSLPQEDSIARLGRNAFLISNRPLRSFALSLPV